MCKSDPDILISTKAHSKVMNLNPYQTPVADLSPDVSGSERFADVGRVVVSWEKLRFIYNGVLVLFTLLVVAFTWQIQMSRPLQVGARILAGAVIANVCFCAGPIVNGYLAWFGFYRRELTLVSFVCGTLFSMGLVIAVVVFLP